MIYDGKVTILLVGDDGVTLKKEVDNISIEVKEDVCMSHVELMKLALEGAAKRIPEEPKHKTLDKFSKDENKPEKLSTLMKDKDAVPPGRMPKKPKDNVKVIDITPKEPKRGRALLPPAAEPEKVEEKPKKEPVRKTGRRVVKDLDDKDKEETGLGGL